MLVLVVTTLLLLALPRDAFRQAGETWSFGLLSGYSVRVLESGCSRANFIISGGGHTFYGRPLFLSEQHTRSGQRAIIEVLSLAVSHRASFDQADSSLLDMRSRRAPAHIEFGAAIPAAHFISPEPSQGVGFQLHPPMRRHSRPA